MAKSLKFTDETYLDSNSIIHNKETLKNILDSKVIYESGSNGNGSWIKYADGTMVCNKYVSGTTDVTTKWGSLYEGSIRCGDYPQPFIEKPFVHATPVNGNGNLIQCFGSNQNETTFGTLYITLPSSFASRAYSINLRAEGKWK